MLRRLTIALLLCLTAWVTLEQQASAPGPAGAAAVAAPIESSDRNDTGESDTRWAVAGRVVVPATESVWKSPVVHAGLAAAPVRAALVLFVGRPRPASVFHHRSAHLLHVPLLI